MPVVAMQKKKESTCICVCMHACLHICMHAYKSVSAHVQVCMCACTPVCAFVSALLHRLVAWTRNGISYDPVVMCGDLHKLPADDSVDDEDDDTDNVFFMTLLPKW